MTEKLTTEGYEQTKTKLHDLETRLADIEKRKDISPELLISVRRSYRSIIRQYLQEMRVYEAMRSTRDQAMPI